MKAIDRGLFYFGFVILLAGAFFMTVELDTSAIYLMNVYQAFLVLVVLVTALYLIDILLMAFSLLASAIQR